MWFLYGASVALRVFCRSHWTTAPLFGDFATSNLVASSGVGPYVSPFFFGGEVFGLSEASLYLLAFPSVTLCKTQLPSAFGVHNLSLCLEFNFVGFGPLTPAHRLWFFFFF